MKEPSVADIARAWVQLDRIRKEYILVGYIEPTTYEAYEKQKLTLAVLETEHLAALEALGIADDDLFDPFEDVPRPKKPTRLLKKSAIVAELLPVWPTIEADLKAASRHGLRHANIRRGMWEANAALRWAKQTGKAK